MIMKKTLMMVCGATSLLAALSLPCFGQGLVKNPSFENNLNTTTPPLAPGAPQGWPYYSSIDSWQGGSGVNDLVYDAGGPFHNAGTPVPDGRRIGFKQGSGTVSQQIDGLIPGARYWIQFRYDVRNGSDLDLAVRFTTTSFGGALDDQLDLIVKPRPARATSSPYYSRTIPFTPDVESGVLKFVVTSRGDSTALLDAVTLVQRDEGNFPVMNPSFEASGSVFDGNPFVGQDSRGISGWAKTGVAGVDDGTGGLFDNGAVPDQALVAFLSANSSLTQSLDPVVKGEDYQVEFAYNASTGSTAHLQVLADGNVVWEDDVSAVGGTQPFIVKSLTFKAASDVASLSFKNTSADGTVLLDNVKVLGKVGTRLPPMSIAPIASLVRVGETTTGSVTVPAERVAQGPTVIKLRSSRREILELVGADANGILSVQFDPANTTKPFTMKGLNVGSASVDIVDSASLLLPADITSVYVAGETLVMNPSFEIDRDSGVGTAPVTYWNTGGGNIGMAQVGNPFLSSKDFNIPDRNKLLRIQNGGTVSQTIVGLVPGKTYGLQFFYNGRDAGYPYSQSLQVNMGGETLVDIPEVIPANQNGLTSFYFVEARFTASAVSELLEFKVKITSGDASLFLDAVSIVPRVEGEIAVMNSSFEGSAMGASWPGYLSGSFAGWSVAGGGYGVNGYSPTTFFVEPFLDNGINSDQDNAFFGQGGVSIKQTIAGLTPGQTYTLVFDYNFRDGRGVGSIAQSNLGNYEASLDGNVVSTLDGDGVPPVDSISPYPGFRHTKPFYQTFVPFTAENETTDLRIAHTGIKGDETMLLDNVRIISGTLNPPGITEDLVDVTVDAGASASFTVAASGSNLSYKWLRNGVVLKDGATIQGSTTATLTRLSASAADSGTYTVLVTDGVGVMGSSATLTVNSVSVSLNARNAGGSVIVAWPSAAGAGFRLQRAATLDGPWTDVGTAPSANGANLEVTVDASGTSGFFRLTQ